MSLAAAIALIRAGRQLCPAHDLALQPYHAGS